MAISIETVEPGTGTDPAPPASAVASWSLFELANMLFSINIVALYFPLWVVSDMGGRDGDYGLANSVAMALIFVSAPLIGALSDRAPRRVPLLIASTVVCCTFTALLGVGGLGLALLCFVIANYAFQAGAIFSDALLPAVSTEATRGKVGGIGVAVGYLGAFVGIGTGLAILSVDPAAKPLVFKATAALMLLFAMPCFLWVREPRRPSATSGGVGDLRRAGRELRRIVARARSCPGVGRFLIGRVFYSDAANTLGVFMGIYATQEVGFSEVETQVLLLLGIVAGIAGGLTCGLIVDRIGPKRTLDWLLGLWFLVFTAIPAIAFLDSPRGLFWFVAPLAGYALGGAWAADRPLMLRLSPPRHLGEFYGLYAMAGRFSAITGPLLWAAMVDGMGLGRPVAVASLAVMVVIAFVILRPVDDTLPRG